MKKVGEIGELDLLMPVIRKVHEFAKIDKYTSLTGYMTWLITSLPSQNFAIYYNLDETGNVDCFYILQVQIRACQLECSIVDAYNMNDEISEGEFEFIENWAKDHNCKYLTCYSNRPDALSRKYGFDKFGTVMIKAL